MQSNKTYPNRGNKPTRTGFGEGLLRAGLNNPRVVCLGADINASVGCNLFADALPHRFFSLGIAEQNCMGAAAGLALSPCDATQAKLAILADIEQCTGPVYLRFGREAVPDFTHEDMPFLPGRSQLLRPGNDLTLIATGHLVWEALQAAEILQVSGIHARVINMHTIKPMDVDAVITAARETGAILTAEEHQITGGLGSAVAEIVVKHHPVPMAFTGMPDRFGESGTPGELMERFGLTGEAIAEQGLRLVNRVSGE